MLHVCIHASVSFAPLLSGRPYQAELATSQSGQPADRYNPLIGYT